MIKSLQKEYDREKIRGQNREDAEDKIIHLCKQ